MGIEPVANDDDELLWLNFLQAVWMHVLSPNQQHQRPEGYQCFCHQPSNSLFSIIKTNTIRTLQTTAEGYQ